MMVELCKTVRRNLCCLLMMAVVYPCYVCQREEESREYIPKRTRSSRLLGQWLLILKSWIKQCFDSVYTYTSHWGSTHHRLKTRSPTRHRQGATRIGLAVLLAQQVVAMESTADAKTPRFRFNTDGIVGTSRE